MAKDALSLESLYLGGEPVVRPFLRRLRLMELIEEALGQPDRRLKLPPAKSAVVMVWNIILSRHPLCEVGSWARRFCPEGLDLTGEEVKLVNDDRLGRTLDRLFKIDLRSLMTRFVVKMDAAPHRKALAPVRALTDPTRKWRNRARRSCRHGGLSPARRWSHVTALREFLTLPGLTHARRPPRPPPPE